MDLHHTGSDEQLVCVKTESLTVTVKGSQCHPVLAGVETSDKEASLRVVCSEDFDITMAGEAETVDFETRGGTYSAGFRSRPLFYEQQNYEIIVEPTTGYTAQFWHENYNVRKAVTPVGSKNVLLTGIINFRNEIGYSDLVILLDGEECKFRLT